MTHNTLEQLYAELESKLQVRLQEIEQQGIAQRKQLEQEQRSGFERDSARLKQSSRQQLNQRRGKARREMQVQQQKTLWQAERQCIEQIVEQACQTLRQQPLDRTALQAWIEWASQRLDSPPSLQLTIKPEWREQWDRSAEPTSMPVICQPLLGGAILRNTEQHIEVDGSWDQRLQALIPQLWKRWHQRVGEDNKD